MSELTWLAELIANHDLSPKLKKHIIKRMKAVEGPPSYRPFAGPPMMQPQAIGNQAPSTIAAMQRHASLGLPPIDPQATPEPGVVAATPATQAAIASRQQAIELAMTGKNEKGRTSPRKF